jgi:hypothetical protein
MSNELIRELVEALEKNHQWQRFIAQPATSQTGEAETIARGEVLQRIAA